MEQASGGSSCGAEASSASGGLKQNALMVDISLKLR